MKKFIILSFFLLAGHRASGQLSALANSGQNSITANGGTSILIHGDGASALDASDTWFGSSTPSVVNFNFSGTLLTGPPTNVPNLSCGSLNDIVDHKGVLRPLSNQVTDSSCEELLGEGNNLERDYYYTQAYDSMCYYLTHCTTQADPQTAFGVFNDATADTITTPQGCAAVKAFLLSILPLRTDDAWFCYCVSGFGLTFNLDTNQNREQLSLLKWLTDNPRCPMIHSEDSAGYVHERFIDYSLWLDTTHWPDTVYDSTLLHHAANEGLRYGANNLQPPEGVSPEAIGSQILLSASILENPFQNSTSILLSIGREAYVTIQVFDILGHQIEGAGYASVFEQGNVTIPINMTNAPPGAYLVRISTANNEKRKR